MTYNVIGINPGHNGSVALVSDGEVLYYIEEERLSRLKYDGNPFRGILDILSKYHVNEIVIGGTTNNLPQLFWTQEDPFTALVRKYNSQVKVTVLGNEHHLGHAATAFYNSGFEKALAIVVDGAGSYKRENIQDNIFAEGFETESIWICEYPDIFNPIYKVYGNNFGPKLRNQNFDFDSAVTITKAYEAVSEYLGFGFIEAGKTMGLSSYGQKDDRIPKLFVQNRGSKDVFMPYYPAGAFIDENRYSCLKKEYDPKEWHRNPSKLTDIQKNLAWQIQNDTQELVGNYIANAIKATGINNVVICGGYGLNCVANYYFKKRFSNINLYCEPISHDGGTSIGLAKLVWYSKEQSRKINKQTHIYYGPKYNTNEILDKIKIYEKQNKIKIKETSYQEVAQLISQKNIVTLFQGGCEAGPRALGNRSILYDSRDPNGKDVVNNIKGREWFRPFAGSVLKEHANDWFNMAGLEESPFMMYAVDVLPNKVKEIPCITHVDNTCRIQTVTKEQNEHYYKLIEEFFKITNVPILFNTSFNLAGEPLVETIEDALNTLFNSQLIYLYLPELQLLIEKNT
jgi:carbamoyltransferase